MSEKVKVVRIDWPFSHDCGDHDIQFQLEAGGDEGPLLVLSTERSMGRTVGGLVAVFRNVDWYLASLVDHDAASPRERWVGLIRGTERENGEAAVAALQRIALAITTGPKVRTGRPGSRHRVAPIQPYGAIIDPVGFDAPIAVENCGEGFDDVASAYPVLTSEMSV